MSFTQEITVDMSQTRICPLVKMKQGDTMRSIAVYPTKDGVPYYPPDGAVAVLRILNRQRQSTEIPAEINTNENGKPVIVAKMSPESVSIVGIAVADMSISVDGEVVSTLNFNIEFEPAPAGEYSIPPHIPGGSTPTGGVSQADFETYKSQVSESINEIREMIPAAGGGGLSAVAANLLIEILGAAVFTQNVSGKINRLKDMLTSGTPDNPDQPGEPDEPTTPEDEITVEDGVMTITAVYSDISVNDGVMTIQ